MDRPSTTVSQMHRPARVFSLAKMTHGIRRSASRTTWDMHEQRRRDSSSQGSHRGLPPGPETTIHVQPLQGHAGDKGNEGADRLAGEGSAKFDPDPIDLRPHVHAPRSKASSTEAIISTKLKREATEKNMEYAREAIEDMEGEAPLVAKIWKSTKHKDISQNIRFFWRYFLWMLIHDGYK
ncbi:hypothetical protein B0H12DRAFT_1128559, partial [Mycena haematopus]